jgi:prostaglandin-endoperoxide synthase 2
MRILLDGVPDDATASEKAMTTPALPARPASKDGFRNGLQLYAVTHFPLAWRAAHRFAPTRSLANRLIIDQLVKKMTPRPAALSTMSPYTSWPSLTNRAYSGRHLPPGTLTNLPPIAQVLSLFQRDDSSPLESVKSTLLFPHFAQWFVDGFLRTDPTNPLKNLSTHDIDLSQLYGQTSKVTNALREGAGGRLKSQLIGGEEYAPYYFDESGKPKPEFSDLEITYPGADRKSVDPTELPPELRHALFAVAIPRGNIHYGFVMVNTLFLREHNRVAGVIASSNPQWDDERVFQTARCVMVLILIRIVIEEYINHITPFRFKLVAQQGMADTERWYRQNWMSIEFDVLYRWHTLIPEEVLLGGTRRRFQDILWNTRLVTEHGLAKLFDECSRQPATEIGLYNTAHFLLDVEEKTIALGRSANLASYNDYRAACTYPRVTSFADISNRPEVQEGLRSVYGSVDNVELFVGLFAEDVRDGAALPTLMGTMVGADAFSQALTNPLLADGVFGLRTLSQAGLDILTDIKSLADLVRRNVPEFAGVRVSLTREGWTHP